MSSNGHSDLAEETTAGAYTDSTSGHEDAVIDTIYNDIRQMATEHSASILRAQATPFEPRVPSPTADTIANAFQQLTLTDAAESRAATDA
jgi:hypothetical protein